MTDSPWQTYQEGEQSRKWKDATTTERVVKWFTLAMQELGIVERMNVTADEAKKAFDMAQRIDRRLAKNAKAIERAMAAQLSTFKSNNIADAEE